MHWIAYGLCGYVVALAVQWLLMPSDGNGLGTMVLYLASPARFRPFRASSIHPEVVFIDLTCGGKKE